MWDTTNTVKALYDYEIFNDHWCININFMEMNVMKCQSIRDATAFCKIFIHIQQKAQTWSGFFFVINNRINSIQIFYYKNYDDLNVLSVWWCFLRLIQEDISSRNGHLWFSFICHLKIWTKWPFSSFNNDGVPEVI